MRLILLLLLALVVAASKHPNRLLDVKKYSKKNGSKKKSSKVKQVMKTAYHLHSMAWNEFRALGSSEFERVLIKATRSSSEQPKEKHVYSILYALSEFDGMADYQQIDVYAVAMHKIWVKINHEDIRSSIKALYILHSVLRLISSEQSMVIRQRIRRLTDDYCKKTKCNYFDRDKLNKKYAKNRKNSNKYNKLLGYVSSYAQYLIDRCQLFSPEFDELLEKNNLITPVASNATNINNSGDDEPDVYTIEYINRLEEERNRERNEPPETEIEQDKALAESSTHSTEVLSSSTHSTEVLSLESLIKSLRNAKKVLTLLLSIRLYPSNCNDLTVASLELIALDLVQLYPKFVIGIRVLAKHYGSTPIDSNTTLSNDKNHRNYIKLLNFDKELDNSQEITSWLTTHTKILTKYGYHAHTMDVEMRQG